MLSRCRTANVSSGISVVSEITHLVLGLLESSHRNLVELLHPPRLELALGADIVEDAVDALLGHVARDALLGIGEEGLVVLERLVVAAVAEGELGHLLKRLEAKLALLAGSALVVHDFLERGERDVRLVALSCRLGR